MTSTLDGVAKKKADEQSAEQQAAVELIRAAKEQGLLLTGTGGLLKQLTKTVLETSLNEEMTEHLGHEKNGQPVADNVRNGTRPKTMLTENTRQAARRPTVGQGAVPGCASATSSVVRSAAGGLRSSWEASATEAALSARRGLEPAHAELIMAADPIAPL